MSGSESILTKDDNGHGEPPAFPVVMRGYDRRHVQEFIENLSSMLAAERRRADETERAVAKLRLEVSALEQQSPSYDHLGVEAGRLLEHAASSARQLVEDAQARAEQVMEGAQASAAEVIRAAEQRGASLEQAASDQLAKTMSDRDRTLAEATVDAEQIRARAVDQAKAAIVQVHADAEGIRDKVVLDHSDMVVETEQLRESRDWLVQYLSRVHEYLAGLIVEMPDINQAANSEGLAKDPPQTAAESTRQADPLTGRVGMEPAGAH